MADIQVIMEVVGQQDMVKAISLAERMEREYKRLDKTFNKGKMTAQQYSKGVAQLDAKYKSLTKTTNQLTASTKQHAAAQALAGKRINRMGANLQQVGYQVGDFAVQVQGGTNVMVALGQQGAQLLGIFGAGGALAGAALAIGTALIAPLMKGKKAAKGLTEEIKSLKAELAELQNTPTVSANVDELLKKEGDLHIEILKLQDEQIKKKRLYNDFVEKGLAQTRMGLNAQALLVDSEDAVNRAVSKREAIHKKIGDYQSSLIDLRNEHAHQEKTTLRREISLLTLIGKHGEKSLEVRRLKKAQAIDIYQAELKQLKLHPDLIQGLLKQKSLAVDLANALNSAADADARRAKIAFSGSSTPEAMQALMYQEYGQSRAAAPKTPVEHKTKKPSKGGGGSKKSDAEALGEYLAGLKQQATLEGKLVGLSGSKREVQEAVIKAQQKYKEAFGPAQEAELRGTLALIAADKERQRVFEEAEQQRKQLVGFMESTLEDGFMSMIDGTKSVKDAFRDMARDIIKELYRVLVVKKLVSSVTSFFGFADGGAFSGGSQIQAYADGGVVGGPTFFPMAGGKTGLMGEAGPEAIMPLKRGANGKLGVQAEGSSQGNVVIHQSFTFQANGDDSVKKIIAQAIPQIANVTQKQIMDSRRRGGSMKAAFG